MNDVLRVTQEIHERSRQRSSSECYLVAISGIDGAGKGYVTSQIVQELRRLGLRAEVINVDGWLNLPNVRFHNHQPAEHFYRHAIRFDEMFEQLILPLKRQRSIRVETNFAEETATSYRRHKYQFENVDVILLEGIYLLQPDLRKHYDWTVWVDCTFETALERALLRGQEGLPVAETIRGYQTVYFPAQEIHFRRDEPRASADDILVNDPRFNDSRQAPTD